MTQLTVGVRELKERLSHYLRQVETGATVTITVHGKPVGQIVPIPPSREARLEEARRNGIIVWNGRKFSPKTPQVPTRGPRTVADLLVEDRG